MSSLRSRIVRQLWRWRTARLNAVERPISQMRLGLDAMGQRLQTPSGTAVEPTQVAGLYAEWLTPPTADSNRLILYLHGGAYSVGSCKSHRGMVAYIAHACRARALVPEYRLAPEHPFPAALDDAVAVYRQLVTEGVSPTAITIMGDSAGGGLSLATVLALRDAGEPLPASLVLLSPWTDLAGTGESLKTCAGKDPWLNAGGVRPTAALYCGDVDPCHPLISPLYADLHNLPPMLIQVGDHEILLSDSTRLAERAKVAGGETTLEVWSGMWHVWHSMVKIVPESQQAIRRIGQFVQMHSPQRHLHER